MRTVADSVHIATISVLDALAICANLVLLYAVRTRTQPVMRTYSILLLNNALLDIASATASVLAIARLVYIREGPSQLYVFVGPCAIVGAWFCHLCQTLHAYLVCHSTLVLLHSFCFRLFSLRDSGLRGSITARATVIISGALYAPTVLMMAVVYSAYENVPPELLQGLHLEVYPAIWYKSVFDYRFVIAVSYVVIVSPISIVSIFIVRKRLIKQLNVIRPDAKSLHSHIAKALSYQLLLPIGQITACSLWLLSVANVWTDETSERLVMICNSFFALGSPLINLTFLPPYRRMFGRVKIAPIQRIASVSSRTSE